MYVLCILLSVRANCILHNVAVLINSRCIIACKHTVNCARIQVGVSPTKFV